jgi:hypothetical protein
MPPQRPPYWVHGPGYSQGTLEFFSSSTFLNFLSSVVVRKLLLVLVFRRKDLEILEQKGSVTLTVAVVPMARCSLDAGDGEGGGVILAIGYGPR